MDHAVHAHGHGTRDAWPNYFCSCSAAAARALSHAMISSNTLSTFSSGSPMIWCHIPG
uniref:Uncharacterized protein n=1 Tax=Arundo donax TaxID=35708 RepID=A0A0A9D4M4_ARUDO